MKIKLFTVFVSLVSIIIIISIYIRSCSISSSNGHLEESDLFIALKQNDLQRASTLLDKDSFSKTYTCMGITLLHAMIIDRNYPGGMFLIEHGADVNYMGLSGRSPLHWAVFHNDYIFVQMLVENGANLASRDNEGLTAEESAIKYNRSMAILYFQNRPQANSNRDKTK